MELPKTQINGLTFWPIPDFDAVRQVATAAYALWLWSTPEALPLTPNDKLSGAAAGK